MQAENQSNLPEPILECECTEPNGKIIRKVYPLVFTKENIQKFYDKSNRYRTLFWKETEHDFAKFLSLLLREGPNGTVQPNGLFWVIDDFIGVFFLTHILPSEDAQVHYTFFDGRHKGRDEITRKMLAYIFTTFEFRRLSAEIPAFAGGLVTQFAREVGFKGEGLKRKASYYKNDWFDVKLYGILKEEALGLPVYSPS